MNINEYRNDGSCRSFNSLSRNKTNDYEFAVGANNNVKIFDFRQMKPRYEFNHTCISNHACSIHCHVSWSPNGKYILVKDTNATEIYWGPSLQWRNSEEECSSFFWDVSAAEHILLPPKYKEPEDKRALIIFENRHGSSTWIDDYLIQNPSYIESDPVKGIHAINPRASQAEVIELASDMTHIPTLVAYNDKTFQLAGASGRQIYIWSHYKLPPYPKITPF